MKAFDRFSDRKRVHEWRVLDRGCAITICRSGTLAASSSLSTEIEGKPVCKHCERMTQERRV